MSKVKLNSDQLKAIRHNSGPLLIIAGAGTGKTTVITQKILYLIEKKLANPDEILALTFTQKAAQEMEERIDVALPYGYSNMWILTFHSFCEKILRREALHIGLDPKFKLMTQAENIQLIRSNLFSFNLNYFRPLGNPNKFIEGLVQHFSRLQDEDITPTDYKSWAKDKDKKDKELANAYQKYEELKVKNGLLDFGDLITKTLKLFRDRPAILKNYQKQFKFILIDEFQDTNHAQNELAILLAKKEKLQFENITVVGDDDQSIYRFRGAAVSNILEFRKNFKKAKVVVLTKNYRSTQNILDHAYNLIQSNNPDRLEIIEKVNKKLVSTRKIKGEKIQFLHTDRVENEADLVAEEIKKLSKKYKYSDFAILVRANNHSEAFVRALSRKGIPYQFLGPGRLFKQPEIIDLISYLRVLYNFEDSPSFYKVVSMEGFNINSRDIAALGNYARKYNISLFEAAEKSENEKILNVVNIIHKHLGLIKKESAGQILYYFLEESGVLQKILDPNNADAEKKSANISKFFDKLKSFEVDHADANLFTIVDWLNLSSELGESPLAVDTDWNEINAVNILTVHSSKGLEFPVVFLVNLVSQRFPSQERHEQVPIPDELIKETLPVGDFHLEEERRLFYVGVTRAKDKLYLTAANYYGEGKRDKKLSPFIIETLGKKFEDKIIKSPGNSFLGFSKPEIDTLKQKNALSINYLSYSQIETFKTCPLHYKLKYILKIPTPPMSAASFGSSIHKSLKKLYELAKENKNINKKVITKLLKDNWIKEGFLDKKHEEKFFKQGIKYLNQYFDNRFNKELLPFVMEQPFTIPISKDLKIGGVIDRVDLLSDDIIEIWDYKTGANVPTQKEVDHNLQLTFYALAANMLKEKPFNKLPEKIKLTLYYFDGDKKITTTRNKSDLIKAKEDLLKIRDEIEKSDFTCSGGFLCKNCEYKNLCNLD